MVSPSLSNSNKMPHLSFLFKIFPSLIPDFRFKESFLFNLIYKSQIRGVFSFAIKLIVKRSFEKFEPGFEDLLKNTRKKGN